MLAVDTRYRPESFALVLRVYDMEEKEGVCPETLQAEELVLMGIGGSCSGCGAMFIPETDVDSPVGDCIEQFREHVVERRKSDSHNP
jgi:hypothetical protein